MSDDKLLIVSLGGHQAEALAQRLRGCSVYCELCDAPQALAAIERRAPKGVILAGAPEEGEPSFDEALIGCGLPILGIGQGALRLLERLGGAVGGVAAEEQMLPVHYAPSPLFGDMAETDRYMTKLWALDLPANLQAIARSDDLIVAFADEEKRIYGLQFTVEANDPEGLEILDHFSCDICHCERWWTTERIVERIVEQIRAQVAGGEALMALSGGVDSSVCAALMHRAIGAQMHCIYIDTGLMRKGDNAIVRERFGERSGIEIACVNARERFYDRLKGVTNPGEKWAVISDEFSRIYTAEAARFPHVRFLVKGTIYPDVLNYSDDEQNLGELTGYELIEPARYLFKSEVRQIGEYLGLDSVITQRQPLPGSGLAMRLTGEASLEKLAIVREADAILREEIEKAGLNRRISRWCAQLCDTTSTGEGSCRYVVALRALNRTGGVSWAAYRMPYDLLERVTERILTELKLVDRVVYDMTPSPLRPADWEI